MSLPYIILSQLETNGKMTGYDITRSFKGNAGLAWTASHQQVYRELGKLEEDGCCYSELFLQEGKPDRKEFTISEKGKKKLDAWRDNSVPKGAYRDKISAKVLASRVTDHSKLIQLLELEVEMTNSAIDKIDGVSPFDIVDEILIDRRVAQLTAHRDWAEAAIHKLKEEV